MMRMMGPDFALANLSGAEFATMATGNPLILLPLGSHEDHGPFLPMGDYLLAEILASRIAGLCRSEGVATLVAPALPFGVADHFGSSPGAMAISPASFKGVLQDLLNGFCRHGLTRIVILNGHGGNVPIIHEVTLALKLSGGPVIPSAYLWKIARLLMQNRLGERESARFGHGAEPLLSISKSLRPDYTVTQEIAAPGPSTLFGCKASGFGHIDFQGIPIDVPVEFDQVPRDAIDAAQPLASAELGDKIAAELVDKIAAFSLRYASEA
jgi:creatinine amidohydrolase